MKSGKRITIVKCANSKRVLADIFNQVMNNNIAFCDICLVVTIYRFNNLSFVLINYSDAFFVCTSIYGLFFL